MTNRSSMAGRVSISKRCRYACRTHQSILKLEVISRKRRMEGYNVLFPIGFDAFGLPTENYAVKTGTHPRIITDENIKRFSNQLKKLDFLLTGTV